MASDLRGALDLFTARRCASRPTSGDRCVPQSNIDRCVARPGGSFSFNPLDVVDRKADVSVFIRWMCWTRRRMFQFLSAGWAGPEGGCFSFNPLDVLDQEADVSVLIRWMCWTGS